MPNLLTCARVALVPVVAAVILVDPRGWKLAAVLFGIAAISDVLDGHIARARGCVSNFGIVMDPVADKLLVGAALISLTAVDRVSPLVAAVIIGRELAVSGLRLRAAREGLLIPASSFGKAKMALQVAMVLTLMAVGTGPSWAEALVYSTVGLTIASALDYYAAYRTRARPAPAAARG